MFFFGTGRKIPWVIPISWYIAEAQGFDPFLIIIIWLDRYLDDRVIDISIALHSTHSRLAIPKAWRFSDK